MLVILTGLPGCGRTAAGKELEKWGFKRLISHTCRERRNGEKDGIDYYFVTEEEFGELELVESNGVYGLHKSELEKLASDCVISVSLDRAQTLKKVVPNSVVVWLDAPVGVRRYRLIHDLGVDPDQAKKLLNVPFVLEADEVIDSTNIKTAEKVLEALGCSNPGEVPVEGDYDPQDKEMILKTAWELAWKKKTRPLEVVVEKDGNEYVLQVKFVPQIRRTRRITGYLASPELFNHAKKAELRDRRAYQLAN
ncbi:MAG: hypothetical protein HPY90_11720 [Syntrophothermus sp.]|uniref:hypothetical protein n=1 Tax=Syntrophothermus sp. TaxID=2736299 RepID=UPI00257A30D0|nr:hypothetical protein [Syntrophothermus sp.]NSW83915.1 hypothetical protein [Syntrophothermus sp.]